MDLTAEVAEVPTGTLFPPEAFQPGVERGFPGAHRSGWFPIMPPVSTATLALYERMLSPILPTASAIGLPEGRQADAPVGVEWARNWPPSNIKYPDSFLY